MVAHAAFLAAMLVPAANFFPQVRKVLDSQPNLSAIKNPLDLAGFFVTSYCYIYSYIYCVNKAFTSAKSDSFNDPAAAFKRKPLMIES